MGKQAPFEWRRAVNRLLFVPERPYFVTAPRADTTQTVEDKPGVKHTTASDLLNLEFFRVARHRQEFLNPTRSVVRTSRWPSRAHRAAIGSFSNATPVEK
jgi:hypothetical protein